MKIKIKIIKKIKSDVNPFLNTVYKNFEYISHNEELGHNENEIFRLLTSNKFYGILAYDATNKLVGYLIGEFKLLPDNRYAYYISYLFLIKKYRNKGIGTKLMKLLIDNCKAQGLKYITLTFDTNKKELYKFYEKFGFVIDPNLKKNSRHEVITLFL